MTKAFGAVAVVAAMGFLATQSTQTNIEAEKRMTGVVQIAAETGSKPARKPDGSPSAIDRSTIAAEITQELIRVGCLAPGLAPGWSEVTQSAAQTFVDRIGGSLPVTTPDYILLTLLKGHEGLACGLGRVATDPEPRGQPVSARAQMLPRLTLLSKTLLTAGFAPRLTASSDVAAQIANATAPVRFVELPTTPVKPRATPAVQRREDAREEPQRRAAQRPSKPQEATPPRRQVTVASARIEPRPQQQVQQPARPKPATVSKASARSDVFTRSQDNSP